MLDTTYLNASDKIKIVGEFNRRAYLHLLDIASDVEVYL
jgi:hypothetical protein